MTTTPGFGHLHPVVPVADALQRAGHEVLWATGAESVARVEQYGFKTAVAGMSLEERVRRVLEARPDMVTAPLRSLRAIAFPTGFGAVAAPAMAQDLRPVIDRFRPALVVHELAELAAPPLARARGIPTATIGFSGALPPPIMEMAAEAVAPLWEAEGLDAPEDAGIYTGIYAHPFPASLGPAPPSAGVRLLRPSAFDGATAATPPPWLTDLGTGRRLAYVTFGTELGARAPWSSVIEALGRCDVDAVVTIGSKLDPEVLGAVPSNVRVERYVPQSFVLERTAVVISHAGAGTLLASVARGVPQLSIPIGADQWENADALAAAGAGLVLEPLERDGATIAAGIAELIDTPAFPAAARRVAADIEGLPAAATLVGELEALAGAT